MFICEGYKCSATNRNVKASLFADYEITQRVMELSEGRISLTEGALSESP